MTYRHCFEVGDSSFRDVLQFFYKEKSNIPFRGERVVLWGDFRQILVVMPKARRQDVVHVSINASYL